MSATIEQVNSPIPYVESHDEEKYSDATVDILLENGKVRSKTLPIYSSSRGIEGLLHCYDRFKQAAAFYVFDALDYFRYFPEVLDRTAMRAWNNGVNRLPANTPRTIPLFEQLFDDFLTDESGTLTPRDDLLAYLESDACKKPRKANVKTHVDRIETLCLYANRLRGVKAELTDDAITMMIFQSFPNAWLNEFKLNRGRPTDFTRAQIVEYFSTKKSVQDASEDNNKKRKKVDQEKETKKHEGKKAKSENMCRKHKTHPWSDCSENPKSKNYYLNPKSPFFRGDRGSGGRGGGRGHQGRGGRGDYHGRGSGRGYHHARDGGSDNNYHYQSDRRSDYTHDRYGQGQHTNNNNNNHSYHDDSRSGRGGNNEAYHLDGNRGGNHNRPGGWY